MIYIESNSTDPYWNLALEDYVFSSLDRSLEYFMLWQNDRTVVVGKYQNAAEEIRPEYVDAHGIRVARRLSGGGAVYHDLGNLNYTFIVDADEQKRFDFSRLSRPVMAALASLGIRAECTGRNDLTIGGAKFCGNSQYVKNGRICHHGCILVSSDLTSVSEALRVHPAKFTSRATQSVRSRVTTIDSAAPNPIGVTRFREALKKEVFSHALCSPYMLTPDDEEAIRKLREEKYATWAWNFGASPEYDMERTQKFPSGLVTVRLKVVGGRIERIRIYGDFFGNREISDLENALLGAPIDGDLPERLFPFPMDEYMSGITAEQLCSLIR